MSEPSGPAPTSRSPFLPTLLGLVLVAAVIVGALAIERATDDDLDLPDTLAGGLRADGQLPEAAVAAERSLEETLGDPVALRTYRDERKGQERSVTLTVIDAEAGPFAPDGPQAEPEALGLARAGTELVREGDVLCRLVWGAVVPQGEDVPDDDPAGLQCQLGADGRTYWLDARGLSADDAVEILEDVAD